MKARSSGGERYPDTVEVGGSRPPAPTIKSCSHGASIVSMPFPFHFSEVIIMADIHVTLPDASTRVLPEGSTVADLAASIGAGLAKAAIAGRVDGELVDVAARLHEG